MSLKLRPTSLASPIDKDRGDYTLFSGEWAMGVSMKSAERAKSRTGFRSLRGILGKPLDMRTEGRANA
jgi:hypothetical protein